MRVSLYDIERVENPRQEDIHGIVHTAQRAREVHNDGLPPNSRHTTPQHGKPRPLLTM